jgi:hypothetical protein
MRLSLAIYGAIYLLVESLDFFDVYKKSKYAAYAFLIFIAISALLAIISRRPIRKVSIKLPQKDVIIEVRIGNLFDVTGAIMISTNTVFEADVAGGKIDQNSLQGQFTAKYYTGDQNTLISAIDAELKKLAGSAPYPMGTVVPITTHGKTFYFTAMATLNDKGNAASTPNDVEQALDGLWSYVRQAGALQELAVPLVGTGRGRVRMSRDKVIELISESFADAADIGAFTTRLIIVIRPEDAANFQINLYEIKDRLRHILRQ